VSDFSFSSERYFRVWHYHADRRRLLLRSTLDSPPATRIDIFCGGVGLMLLRPFYHGITIRSGTAEERTSIDEMYDASDIPGQLFVIGDSLRNFVISGPMQWHEDEGSYRDPSRFGHIPATP